MSHALALVVRFLARQVVALTLIVAVLIGVSWLHGEWSRHDARQRQLEANGQLLDLLRADVRAMDAEIDRVAADWQREIAAKSLPLRQEAAALERRIARVGPLWQEALRRFNALDLSAKQAREAAIDARRDVERRQQDIFFWDAYFQPRKLVELQAARAKLSALEATAAAWEAARDRVAPTFEASPMRTLSERRTEAERAIEALSTSVSPLTRELETRRNDKQQAIATLDAGVAEQRERLRQDPTRGLVAAVLAWLPLALVILVGALAMPLVLKTFFYFVLAPLASRLPPVRILAEAGGDEGGDVLAKPEPSSVSTAIDVGAGEELLVQADFLQSSSRTASHRTQWFLNARLPFASLASGMFALTRIRPEGATATRVVVSSQQDPLGEVGVVTLPEGSAIVLQPRALAGVVKPVAEPLRISRHWRLGSLHAWLTLQLRYLVFHGPCRLVLKGCRGVRAEAPQPGQPRLVNQAATLGFSAGLGYQTTRCETFIAYLRGKEDLFNDLFSGGPGWYFYEERPADSRRAGLTGRGLQGLVDAGLKAFGI